MKQRFEKYNAKKVERLKYIEDIFARTFGWTVQLMNLYEERKRLRLIVSRMRKPDGRDNSNSKQRKNNKKRRSSMGIA